jgi:hypothetical protein
MRVKGFSAMAVGEMKPPQDKDPGIGGKRKLPHEPDSKPVVLGEYVGKHLIFGTTGKVVGGQAWSPTGLGKSDRPG